ncbi:SGNH/GDSL hydrolase family protein [Solimicrobium silvestre]|uniref:GDSL-like Lipase/Acylhydrolase n=1 Tax=Solimicrobium silvestre TaxID=2099400 RepID=A0A2S9H599_9BURK|nr:SGNH/GDSL hydrolase family protein [Solimicrobium silvestre]PRC95046.1 GDSL-like Lipase/Acylhydrolase [Solimicrobium silvestre]
MRQNKFSLVVAAAIAVLVAGCGGGGSAGNQAPKVQFSSQVSFGDSLSDVGTYAVGLIGSSGGGRYTVNAALANGMPAPTNWTELMAATLHQSAPCPAETGLNGAAAYDLSIPVVMHTPGCTGYAQGGAMVTYPYGPGNANVGPFPNGNPVDGSALLGQLTVPVVTQIQNHLTAHGGSFSGNEVVFLLAGGNDAIVNTEYYLGGGQTAAAAVQAMTLAGTQLAGYINTMILANGAKYVVVLNIPDLSTTPFGNESEAAFPGARAVIKSMVTAFNSQLQAGLTSSNVLIVDVNTVSTSQVMNPSAYGLTDVTDTACNLAPAVNPLSSSLVCSAKNVIAGDISHYEFADQVHPTPYGNILIARYVSSQMAIKGWL